MKNVNLADFIVGIKDRRFKELVQHHIKRQSTIQIREGCTGTIYFLPEEFQLRAMEFIDHILPLIKDRDFWDLDCQTAFSVIIKEASDFYEVNLFVGMENFDSMPSEKQELVFNLFQIVTMSFAYNASLDKNLRRFVGIKKGWFS